MRGQIWIGLGWLLFMLIVISAIFAYGNDNFFKTATNDFNNDSTVPDYLKVLVSVIPAVLFIGVLWKFSQFVKGSDNRL
jgi:hypothetical protein